MSKRQIDINLIVGKHYFVRHRSFDNVPCKRMVRRIFKSEETRFNSIKCFVFTSQVSKDVTMRKEPNSWVYTGKRTPSKELSIPYYDILEIKEA